jgi:hypothetical protein
VGDRIAGGTHTQRVVTCRDAQAKRSIREIRGERMPYELRRRCARTVEQIERALVVQPPARLTGISVSHLSDLVMRKHECAPYHLEQPMRNEVFEGWQSFFFGQPSYPSHAAEIDPRAQHGGRRQHSASRWGQTCHPGTHELLHAGRERNINQRASVTFQQPALQQGFHDLDYEEGVPTRVGEQSLV